MSRKSELSLYKQAEPIKINPFVIVLMAFIFALVFFLIGSAFRHYPSIQGVI